MFWCHGRNPRQLKSIDAVIKFHLNLREIMQDEEFAPRDLLRTALLTFFKKHCPRRIPSLDGYLIKYEGEESKLFRKLENKYHETPNFNLDTLTSVRTVYGVCGVNGVLSCSKMRK